MTEARDDLTRETGYYWVLFNWPMFIPNREPQWQPASWDERTKTWALIGSRQEVPEDQPCLIKVGDKLEKCP